MLYRFREAMLIEAGLKRNPNSKEPLLPETTKSIAICEQTRKDMIKEISRKISRIQDCTQLHSNIGYLRLARFR